MLKINQMFCQILKHLIYLKQNPFNQNLNHNGKCLWKCTSFKCHFLFDKNPPNGFVPDTVSLDLCHFPIFSSFGSSISAFETPATCSSNQSGQNYLQENHFPPIFCTQVWKILKKKISSISWLWSKVKYNIFLHQLLCCIKRFFKVKFQNCC